MKSLIFIWIPKTAGTSLFNVLLEKFKMQLFTAEYYKFNNLGNVSFGHCCLKQIINHGIVTNDFYTSSTVFSIVRNPYDRAVSLWGDYIRTQRIRPDTTLVQFLSILNDLDLRPGYYNSRGFSMCSQQAEWILPGTKIYQFEDIVKTGIPDLKIKTIPHLNRTKDKPYQEFLDHEAIQLINKIYSLDFAILKYPKT